MIWSRVSALHREDGRTVLPAHDLVAAQRRLPESKPALPSGARATRSSVGAGAPSNKRLKLAAPACWGRIAFVTNQARRRSLSAIR